MTLNKPLTIFIAALCFSCAANATVLTGSTGSPANTVTDYSAPGLVAFDLDLDNFSSTRLNFMVEEADLIGPLSMNAIVRNLAGAGITRFNFSLEGISFAMAGSVTPAFGVLGSVNSNATLANINFSAPEFAEFHIGNPIGVPGKMDWQLSTAGLRAGDMFSITASVPEPATTAMMLPALLMLGAFGAARRRKTH
jgi:MYXO-CTERM domain-containing protein